ncbi:ovarian tumor, otubain, partial [Tanacetum coccineum]
MYHNGNGNDDVAASILEELKNGVAKFELVSTPVTPLFATSTSFFARIGHLEVSPALRKVESFRVHKVTGDGRCMFRALVKGMALNKSVTLSAREERENADELRMAIKEVLCDNDKERHKYEEALIAITVEESLKRLETLSFTHNKVLRSR